MARQEIEEAMSNFCHPENPGSSHWLGCACSESAWAEKLAAAEARIRKLESVGNAREAEVTAHMEARYAAEERARRLEEALRNAVEMIHDANGPLEYAKANDWMRGQLLAIQTPPPEAEKRGEGA